MPNQDKFKVGNSAFDPGEAVNTLNPLAFPLGFEESNDGAGPVYQFDGMSLLDYFAGQVLPAAIQNLSPSDAAKLSYETAEQMLLERKRFLEQEQDDQFF